MSGKGKAAGKAMGFLTEYVDDLLRKVDDFGKAAGKAYDPKLPKNRVQVSPKKSVAKPHPDLAKARRGTPPKPKKLTPAQAKKALQEGKKWNGGKTPINSKYANKQFPLKDKHPDLAKRYPDGVTFSPQGYPQFGHYSVAEVELPNGFTTRTNDFKLADQALPHGRPPGFTWHHVENSNRLQLVPTDLHDAIKHSGGFSQR